MMSAKLWAPALLLRISNKYRACCCSKGSDEKQQAAAQKMPPAEVVLLLLNHKVLNKALSFQVNFSISNF